MSFTTRAFPCCAPVLNVASTLKRPPLRQSAVAVGVQSPGAGAAGARKDAIDGQVWDSAPSTTDVTVSHPSPVSGPHSPRSWPTTFPSAARTTGDPELPPKMPPKVWLL